MTSLYIASSGMCTALGFNQTSTVAAINSHLDHFRETDFWSDDGHFLLGAALYNVPFWGEARLLYLCQMAINDCFQNLHFSALDKILLIIIGPEAARCPLIVSAVDAVFTTLSADFHPDSLLLKEGKTGIISALNLAQKKLYEENVDIESVLLVGVDSYLVAQTINGFLEQNRLLTANNSDGFIPGEGVGALLLQRDEQQSGTYIRGIGESHEAANILQDEKINRAVGLTTAINQAIQDSGILLSETDFRLSDISGESYYFNEAAVAVLRAFDKKVEQYPHRQLATYLGETGAAVGALSLAYLVSDLANSLNMTEKKVLLHFSRDDGKRAALIIEQQGAK